MVLTNANMQRQKNRLNRVVEGYYKNILPTQDNYRAMKTTAMKHMVPTKLISIGPNGEHKFKIPVGRQGMNQSTVPRWVWSCPIDGMQYHQYTGAIMSTRLGNASPSSNPTLAQSGYIPTGQLLFHSAGSGKTLLMLLTAFYWFVRWWAKPPMYSLPVSRRGGLGVSQGAGTGWQHVATSNMSVAKGVCNIILFVSERAQVEGLRNEHGLFNKIMRDIVNYQKPTAAVTEAFDKFKALLSDYETNLPPPKVITKFSGEPNAIASGFVRQQGAALFLNIAGAGRVGTAGHKTHHPLIRYLTPVFARELNATLTDLQDRYGRLDEPIDSVTKYGNTKKSLPFADLYLKLKTYVYMCLVVSGRSGADAYKEASSRVDFSDGKGEYYQFVFLFIGQFFSQMLKARAAPHLDSQTLGGGQLSDMTCWRYPSFEGNDRPSKNELLSRLRPDDFVRFAVGASSAHLSYDFQKSTAGWNSDSNVSSESNVFKSTWTEFCKRSKGGVSPIYRVMSVKETANKEIKIKLQRMLIHPVTSPSSPCYPLYNDVPKGKRSNVKDNFYVYDIFRFNRQLIPITPAETMFDNAALRDAQLTLSTGCLSAILQHAGARMHATSPIVSPVMSEESTRKGIGPESFWWLPYGKHVSFPTSNEDDMRAYWERLGVKFGNDSKMCKMPKVLMLGMTSQMLVHVFKKLPDDCLIIVDEVQKYTGNQDMTPAPPPVAGAQLTPAQKQRAEEQKHRQMVFCLLSEAVKPRAGGWNGNAGSPRSVGRENGQSGNGANDGTERYFCTPEPGNGVIQAASATPLIIDLNAQPGKSVNELQRMFRLLGQARNIVLPVVKRSMVADEKRMIQWKKVMRSKIKDALIASKIVISFVDLSMDASKVPTVTERGVGKSEVRVTAPHDYLSRLSQANNGTGDSVETRIGYPQMEAVMAAQPPGAHGQAGAGKSKPAGIGGAGAPATGRGRGAGRGGRGRARGAQAQAAVAPQQAQAAVVPKKPSGMFGHLNVIDTFMKIGQPKG